MIIARWILGIIITLIVLAEIGCRIYYQHRFGMPFHSKAIGEYPYSQFVEQTDPPLFYRFKKRFRSPQVTLNRFRCRGEEPAPDGAKKRILLIGESEFFGVKLPREKDIWSYRLERLLKIHGYTNWEVINAGNPMYNTVQHRILWEEELREANPDILLISFGGNDVTQAWMMGSTWEPGAPWPWKFILALERKSPWWNKVFSHFCFYFLLRRRMTSRPGFKPKDDTLQWDRCLGTIEKSLRAIVTDARRMGAKVGFMNFGMALDREPKPEDRNKLDAIQSNWESHSKGNMALFYKYYDDFREHVCPKLGLPFIDLEAAFRQYPRRFECFLDIVHLNKLGMRHLGDVLFRELVRLGWLDAEERP